MGKISSIFVVAAMSLLSGCASIGPGTITRDRFDYTTVLSDSWKSQMLLNMAKLRYGDAPVFLDVASVINSYEISGSGSGGNWQFHPVYQSGASIGATGFYADRPTITYSPITGEKFARSMMTPVPPSSILNLIQAGYPTDAIFRIMVQSINGIQNRYGGSAAAHPADPEFYPLIEKLRRIQNSGNIGLRVEKLNDRESALLVFKGKVDEKLEADSLEVRKILGLDPQEKQFKVVYGLISANDKEIAILSRSMLQVMIDMSSYIEVPEIHVAEKRVNPGLKDESTGGVPVPPLIRIHSSSGRPDDAFVAVPYRNHWFWIDDRDQRSKLLFSYLMFVFTLVETGGKEAAPVVTIPAR